MRGAIIEDAAEAKRQGVDDAVVSLTRVSPLFDPDTALVDELERLAGPGRLPNFVEIGELARGGGVRFTPRLAAVMATVGLFHWKTFGAEGLTAAPYLAFDQLDGEPERIVCSCALGSRRVPSWPTITSATSRSASPSGVKDQAKRGRDNHHHHCLVQVMFAAAGRLTSYSQSRFEGARTMRSDLPCRFRGS
jgi:hypothetical protein